MNNIKKYVRSGIIISLLGELYFYPFQGDFRFSAGVIALSLVLLLKEDQSEIFLGLSTASTVLLLRVFISSLSRSRDLIVIL